MFRHNERSHRNPVDERNSAHRIVGNLVRQSDLQAPEMLRLQREIIDQEKMLGEIDAGIGAAGDMHKVSRTHEHQLREIETEMKGSLAKLDAAHAAELEELKADLEKKLRESKEEKRELKKSMQDMHTE